MRLRNDADVLVVGAGPAGLVVADSLQQQGFDTLVLEAGARLRRGSQAPEVDRRMWPFTSVGPSSFDWYRVRALGGRSWLWGGWAYRFPPSVFHRGGWPYSELELRPWYELVEQSLRLRSGRLDPRYVRVAQGLGLSIVPKRALMRGRAAWSPIHLATARRARVDAVGSHLEFKGTRATSAEVIDLRTERVHAVRARAFVLAASPIETARILLLSQLPHHRGIGTGLVDHMVASYVLIEPSPAPALTRRGPFPGCALVESFVNAGDPQSQRSYRGGFSIELRGPMPLEELGIERMVPSDKVDDTSATVIHAIGEIFPDPCRRIDLDAERRDRLGRPLPRIHFDWTSEDRARAKDMKTACKGIADAIAIKGSRLIPFVDPLQPGAGHEAGTCAMGPGPDAVCDAWGKLRSLENVWVADASAMPTAGDRHPTLTLLAHAARAADSVARWLRDREIRHRRTCG